ncbi:hypothetical protein [Haemophilus sp.]
MSEENSISVENRMYEKLKELLDKVGFSFTPRDELHRILINFEPASDMETPISILISIIMEGRGINFFSQIKDKKANNIYKESLLEENYHYRFLKWVIDDDQDMICTIDLFIDEEILSVRNLKEIFALIVSSHNRINDKITKSEVGNES